MTAGCLKQQAQALLVMEKAGAGSSQMLDCWPWHALFDCRGPPYSMRGVALLGSPVAFERSRLNQYMLLILLDRARHWGL